MATSTDLIPSREQMELAGYTIGCFISDLDVMASRLRRILDSDRGPPRPTG